MRLGRTIKYIGLPSLLSFIPAKAQDTISGVVKDDSGIPLEGMVVSAINPSGETFYDTTDAYGYYEFNFGNDCDYIAGDVNHNGTPLELGDVIKMISLYRGSSTPDYTCNCPGHSIFPPEADPNGNCVPYELADVIRMIGAYRGSTTAEGCPDCPPTG